jgi:gluconokinase
MIVVVMGVSGAGKTTIGLRLGESLGWKFIEADEMHSKANVEKMRGGGALTDEDRLPWLQSIAALLKELGAKNESAVLACSALRHSYRKILRSSGADVRFVFLRVSRDEARDRIAHRSGHFMPASLVDSQFETLEEPKDAVVVDASRAPDEIVAEIRDALGL